ncbi:hypothetical protein LTR62_003475 [Meristemomyces frigidus]|uniref:Uncharacterized protein n=1 Tax=Meristemomyces frigidus TaxID=1508187 RepID=A0AAN7YGY7_9PEZI|nr:hypothetical protein LTR62_003475 [Meristemomyces frigidus]
MRLQATGIILLLVPFLSFPPAAAHLDTRGFPIPHPDDPVPIVDPVPAPEPIEPEPVAPEPIDPTDPTSPSDQNSPVPLVPGLPGSVDPSAGDTTAQNLLGLYSTADDAPFSSYEGEWIPYYSKVFDVFESSPETYYDARPLAAGATKTDGPLASGRPTSGQVLTFAQTATTDAEGNSVAATITTFDPSQPTDICGALVSMGNARVIRERIMFLISGIRLLLLVRDTPVCVMPLRRRV